jgi:hypothetical protein
MTMDTTVLDHCPGPGAGGPVRYWHACNSVDLSRRPLRVPAAALPPVIRRLLSGAGVVQGG